MFQNNKQSLVFPTCRKMRKLYGNSIPSGLKVLRIQKCNNVYCIGPLIKQR